MPSKDDSPAPKGDVENKNRIPQKSKSVKGDFSLIDSKPSSKEKAPNNLEIETKKGYNESTNYSLKNNEENEDILDDREVIEYVPIRKVKMKTFPPYNESESDANEWSTRWAHREEVESGAQKIVFYHNRCYVIEKYDSLPLKYQIEGSIKYNDYKTVRKGIEDARNRYEQPEEEMARIVGSSDGRYNSDGGRRPSLDYSSVEHGREDREVWGMGKKQDGKWKIQSDIGRSDEYDSKNRAIKSLKDTNYSLKDEYWHTGLTKAQIEAVEKWVRNEGKPEATRITDADNWYKGRLATRDGSLS